MKMIDKLAAAAAPIQELLREQGPHATAIITAESGQLLEGVAGLGTMEKEAAEKPADAWKPVAEYDPAERTITVISRNNTPLRLSLGATLAHLKQKKSSLEKVTVVSVPSMLDSTVAFSPSTFCSLTVNSSTFGDIT